jgi:3-hydroxyisobutyrate dehydrogenase-like beta-hydroxyacid dehydrogenase
MATGHVFTIIAPGAMGSAVARRMHQRGATVRTSLAGRSAASARRAAECGMIDVASDRELVDGVEIVLSIVPPGEALALARRLRAVLGAAARKPLVIDCNAVNPATVARIAEALAPSGASFVDGAIIGPPPRLDGNGPRFYLAGAAASGAALLRDYGIDIRPLDGPVGAASALKMSYAGITKGLTALGAAMMLGAAANGSAAALLAELAESQPNLLAYLTRSVPDMYGKAYRWVAEMREVAGFLGADAPANQIYEGMARLYETIAQAAAEPRAPGNAITTLDSVLASGVK